MENKKIEVISAVNYIVGLNIPELRFSREFRKPGEKKLIDFDILYEGVNNTGVKTLFDEGILYIKDKEVLEELGLNTSIEVLNENQIIKMLKVDTLSDFKTEIEKLTLTQINQMVDVAIKLKFTDFEKCKILEKKTGIDVIHSVTNYAD